MLLFAYLITILTHLSVPNEMETSILGDWKFESYESRWENNDSIPFNNLTIKFLKNSSYEIYDKNNRIISHGKYSIKTNKRGAYLDNKLIFDKYNFNGYIYSINEQTLILREYNNMESLINFRRKSK
jgi:hypothetical protein